MSFLIVGIIKLLYILSFVHPCLIKVFILYSSILLTDFTKLFEIISELCIENDIKNAICGELKSGEIKINKVKIGICLEKAFFRLNIVLNLFIFLDSKNTFTYTKNLITINVININEINSIISLYIEFLFTIFQLGNNSECKKLFEFNL